MDHPVQGAVTALDTLAHDLHGRVVRHVGAHKFNVAPQCFLGGMATGDDHPGIGALDQPTRDLQAEAPGSPAYPPHASAAHRGERLWQRRGHQAMHGTHALAMAQLDRIGGGL